MVSRADVQLLIGKVPNLFLKAFEFYILIIV